MSKYELTISSNYVRHWGVVEGVREFFQNAIDESNSNPEHSMSWNYDNSTEVLTISNKNCKLSINSLLLGNTSKTDGKSIGQFGEGYKVAIVVLLREGKEVTIHNGDELWTTRMVNSRRYKDKVPVVDVQKFGISGNDLIVEISGITESEYKDIKENNLVIENEYDSIKTSYGEILIDKPGKIYVSGLYICSAERFKYGYNINSDQVILNRDRNLVSMFDITWNSSKMLCEADDKGYIKLWDLMEEDIKDIDYINTFIHNNSRARLHECFEGTYGKRIPVSTQEEYDYFKSKGMNPVFVSTKVVTLLGDYYYNESYEEKKFDCSLYGKLISEIEKNKEYIPTENYDTLISLIEDHKCDLEEIEVNA